MDHKGEQGNFWGDGYMHNLDYVMVSQVYMYVKTYRIVHFKYVQLIVYHVYLNKAV